MALIVYPDTGYDTLCSLADAEAIILANIPAAQHTSWDGLVDGAKEIQLRQATMLIKNKVTLPATLEDDLKFACAYLANSSIDVSMDDDDGKGSVKTKEIVGVVKTEWFYARKDSNSFPDMVNMLLKQYELTASSSFSFERA